MRCKHDTQAMHCGWCEDQATLAEVRANLHALLALCKEAAVALQRAQRYGAGDWTDLIRRLEG